MTMFRYSKKGNEAKLIGKINEFSSFAGLFDKNQTETIIDMSGVYSVNSTGVRSWVDYLKAYHGKILYRNCSMPVIDQFNMVPEFMGQKAWVESFYSLFFCNACHQEEPKLLEVGKNVNFEEREVTEIFFCSTCKSPLEPDFDPEEYLLFLSDVNPDLSNQEDQEPPTDQEIEEQMLRPITMPRKPLRTKVSLPNQEYSGTVYAMFTENISQKGLFICSYLTFPKGYRFDIDFELPGPMNKILNIKGTVEVAWVRDEATQKNLLPGMGVKFVEIDDESMEAIERYIENFSM